MLILTLSLWTHIFSLFCWHLQTIYSSVLAHFFFVDFLWLWWKSSHMIKYAVGSPSLCLGMSVVYPSTRNAFFFLKCISISRIYVLFCGFMKLLWGWTTLQWSISSALWDIVFEMSQSLALVGQPTRIGHVWRTTIRHSTLPTNHLLIYNNHLV
jgi:hypothetical protein